MKRPSTALGAGPRPANEAPTSAGAAYAIIPLILGLPVGGYVLAKIYHINIEQYAPVIFIIMALGLAAIFNLAAESQKAAQRRKKLSTPKTEPKNLP